MGQIDELNARFALDRSAGGNVAEIIAGNGGLPAVAIKTQRGAEGTIYLHGAHVAAWKPESQGGGEEVLWLSEKSVWQDEKPIRGGVPICFPWFGGKKDDSQAPAHGFARLRPWSIESIEQSGATVTVTLSLTSDAATKKYWPADFKLQHRVTIGDELVMSLILTNTGSASLTAEEAQHTYFTVGDVHGVKVTGLDGVRYIDKVDGAKEKTQQGDITITGETDRVYLDVTSAATIDDPAKARKIQVSKDNSRATVVWNPWIAKSKAMPDFGDEEWPGMICVETCNVAALSIQLQPGQQHIMTTRVRVQPR